jgi:hypothetical protein
MSQSKFYKVTLVKVCTLVQKVVTLASGKGCFFACMTTFPFFFETIYTVNILFITQALRSLTAEIAIKCLILL